MKCSRNYKDVSMVEAEQTKRKMKQRKVTMGKGTNHTAPVGHCKNI